jgi:hypothetical protein
MGELIGNLEGIFQKTIGEMKVGEEGYSTAYCIEFDYDLNTYLELNAPIFEEFEQYWSSENTDDFDCDDYQKPNKDIYIKRIGKGKHDFLIDISKSKGHKWAKTNAPFDYDPEMIKDNEIKNLAIIKYSPLEEKIQKALANENYELAERLKNQNK